MDKNKLGNKFLCHQCGCKFYDLNQPTPLCPQCGTDQSKTPPKTAASLGQSGDSIHTPAKRTRSSRRKKDQDNIDDVDSFSDDDADDDISDDDDLAQLEDGLTVIDDDDLIEADSDDFSEDDD